LFLVFFVLFLLLGGAPHRERKRIEMEGRKRGQIVPV
jgi:hypothetical protein